MPGPFRVNYFKIKHAFREFSSFILFFFLLGSGLAQRLKCSHHYPLFVKILFEKNINIWRYTILYLYFFFLLTAT